LKATVGQVGDRPTEVAIGLAAADLFAALPKDVQRRLRELPETVKRLEEEARTMRKRVDELNEKLAEAGTDPTGGRSAVLEQFDGETTLAEQRERVLNDLRAARDAAGRRLASAVAALENIRLDLLRLQAGAGSVASLTAALEAVKRIGADIDQAVAGRAAADAMLDKPTA
jgi:serine/threonine-protein kinase